METKSNTQLLQVKGVILLTDASGHVATEHVSKHDSVPRDILL